MAMHITSRVASVLARGAQPAEATAAAAAMTAQPAQHTLEWQDGNRGYNKSCSSRTMTTHCIVCLQLAQSQGSPQLGCSCNKLQAHSQSSERCCALKAGSSPSGVIQVPICCAMLAMACPIDCHLFCCRDWGKGALALAVGDALELTVDWRASTGSFALALDVGMSASSGQMSQAGEVQVLSSCCWRMLTGEGRGAVRGPVSLALVLEDDRCAWRGQVSQSEVWHVLLRAADGAVVLELTVGWCGLTGQVSQPEEGHVLFEATEGGGQLPAKVSCSSRHCKLLSLSSYVHIASAVAAAVGWVSQLLEQQGHSGASSHSPEQGSTSGVQLGRCAGTVDRPRGGE
jgi:hypothetical protein